MKFKICAGAIAFSFAMIAHSLATEGISSATARVFMVVAIVAVAIL